MMALYCLGPSRWSKRSFLNQIQFSATPLSGAGPVYVPLSCVFPLEREGRV